MKKQTPDGIIIGLVAIFIFLILPVLTGANTTLDQIVPVVICVIVATLVMLQFKKHAQTLDERALVVASKANSKALFWSIMTNILGFGLTNALAPYYDGFSLIAKTLLCCIIVQWVATRLSRWYFHRKMS